MSREPLVDLVIAVHDRTRPLRRAIDSVLDSVAAGAVRVTVVCHGIAASEFTDQLAGLDRENMRVVEFADGVASPAGPFTHGIELATAEYVAIMGSDDFLEPGAMAAWIDHVRARSCDVLLVRLRYQGGAKLHLPLTRLGRHTNLDPVKDRLFYQTAPLGLLKRSTLESHGIGLTAGLPVGSDMNFSARLWTAGVVIDHAADSPCYVIADDAVTRVTTTPRPVRETVAPMRDLFAREWVRALPKTQRAALVTKNIRIHVVGVIAARTTADRWEDGGIAELAATAREILAVEPLGLRPLCRADRRLLDAVLEPGASAESVLAAWDARARASRFDVLVPRNLACSFHRESTLRRYVLYRLSK